jgi:hypothetical protein
VPAAGDPQWIQAPHAAGRRQSSAPPPITMDVVANSRAPHAGCRKVISTPRIDRFVDTSIASFQYLVSLPLGPWPRAAGRVAMVRPWPLADPPGRPYRWPSGRVATQRYCKENGRSRPHEWPRWPRKENARPWPRPPPRRKTRWPLTSLLLGHFPAVAAAPEACPLHSRGDASPSVGAQSRIPGGTVDVLSLSA